VFRALSHWVPQPQRGNPSHPDCISNAHRVQPHTLPSCLCRDRLWFRKPLALAPDIRVRSDSKHPNADPIQCACARRTAGCSVGPSVGAGSGCFGAHRLALRSRRVARDTRLDCASRAHRGVSSAGRCARARSVLPASRPRDERSRASRDPSTLKLGGPRVALTAPEQPREALIPGKRRSSPRCCIADYRGAFRHGN
jgi:hypothetical protein